MSSNVAGPKRLNPHRLVRKEVAELLPYIPGKPIRSVRREFGLEKIIKLASNECPLEIPQNIVTAITAGIKSISRYPDGHSTGLRQAMADYYRIPAESFLIGNGAEECIRMISQAFLNPEDDSVIPDPSFDAYRTATSLASAGITRVPLVDFHIDLDAVFDSVTHRTKIIWLCSPNNPTGTVILKDEFERFLDRLPDNKIVILDQAYWEYLDSREAANALDYIQSDARVIGIRTFSKVYGLAGIRIGFLTAHPAVIEMVSKVKLPFNVNVLAQAAAMAALNNPDFVHHHLEVIKEERIKLRKALEERGLQVVPSETNFLFVRLPVDGDELFKHLLPKGIIIRPGSIFGWPEFMRLSVGVAADNQDFLLKFDHAIKEINLN